MTKTFNKKKYLTWGVEKLIPEDVLQRMVAKNGFDVNVPYEAALSKMEKALWRYTLGERPTRHPVRFTEAQTNALKKALASLDPDPARDKVFMLGRVLENAFVVQIIEEIVAKSDRVPRRIRPFVAVAHLRGFGTVCS